MCPLFKQILFTSLYTKQNDNRPMSAKPKKLTKQQIQKELETLENWSYVQEKLQRRFKFKDFVEAFGFITQVALIAESMNHHPEWSNIYHTVIVDLTTHDVGGISNFDIVLANRIEQLYKARVI